MSATARAPLSMTALSRMTWPQAVPAAPGQPVLQVVQAARAKAVACPTPYVVPPRA